MRNILLACLAVLLAACTTLESPRACPDTPEALTSLAPVLNMTPVEFVDHEETQVFLGSYNARPPESDIQGWSMYVFRYGPEREQAVYNLVFFDEAGCSTGHHMTRFYPMFREMARAGLL